MRKFAFTVITSPHPLSKQIELDPEGKLKKTTLGQCCGGQFERVAVESLEEFAAVLGQLTTHNALLFGVFEQGDRGKFTTKEKKLSSPGAVARCSDDVGWPAGPGFEMLDHDPRSSDDALDRDGLVEILREACPFLANVRLLWRPSASSLVGNTVTGEQVRGVTGQRLYIPVSRAADIPRIGQLIFDRLWLAGHGYHMISTAGSRLPRTLVDRAVWQPERLDFAGGAVCVPPLQQGSLDPEIIEGDLDCLDVATVPELTAGERIALERLMKADYERMADAAAKQREAYIEARAAEFAGPDASPEAIERAKATLRAAVEGMTLYGDFLLRHHTGAMVAVSDILDNPRRWHGETFYDPLEPDVHADPRIARANLFGGGRPHVHSFAHGGMRFYMVRQTEVVRLTAGDTHLATDRTLELMRRETDLFDPIEGDTVMRLVGRGLKPVTADWLTDRLGRIIRFETYNNTRKKWLPTDPPNKLIRSILAKTGERMLPVVKAICTAPTITPDGRVISTPGINDEFGLLLLADRDWPAVPDAPSDRQIKQAVTRLTLPFRDFPFVAPEDKGVLLSALLTAVARPCLPLAPAHGFDAPTAGSGKTLLARCVSIIATGEEPALSPPFDDDEEARKAIFSLLLGGAGCIVVDNIVGQLDSANLAAALTNRTPRDRLLGSMATVTVANRALWLVTGNNLRPVGDLVRRVLLARIDPKTEASDVYLREFALDPADYCRRHRLDMVAAALTILRGYCAAGRPKVVRGRNASFEEWSDLVRSAVAWVGANGFANVVDPLDVLKRQQAVDPEQQKLAGLLLAWHECFGATPASIADALRESTMGTDRASDLGDAIAEITAGRDPNPARLGRWIEQRADKVVGGLCFSRLPERTSNKTWWRVVRASADDRGSDDADTCEGPTQGTL